MNNSTKAISLVAVLALCCAALAGSAYAYSATYVDTIGQQPIENVYVTINDSPGNISYGVQGLDLDIEYNTLTKGGVTGYNVEAGTINNGTGATNVNVDTTDNTVVFTAMIDKVSLQAYGDAAEGTLTVSNVATNVDAFHTAGVTIKYALVEGTEAPGAYAPASEGSVSADFELALDTPMVVSLWIQITVAPLNEESVLVSIGEDEDEVDYYAPIANFTIAEGITVGAMDVVYVFQADQA